MKNRILIAATFVSLLGPSIASACALHTSSITGLQVSHPASITVSVATRNAMESGTVVDLGVAGAGEKQKILAQIENAFHRFGEIAQQQQSRGESFTVYLTESRLWTRFNISDNGWLVEHHVNGPEKEDTVIVLSDTALKELFDDTLSVKDAEELKLLVVDSDKDVEIVALRSFGQILSAFLHDDATHTVVTSHHHEHSDQS